MALLLMDIFSTELFIYEVIWFVCGIFVCLNLQSTFYRTRLYDFFGNSSEHVDIVHIIRELQIPTLTTIDHKYVQCK